MKVKLTREKKLLLLCLDVSASEMKLQQLFVYTGHLPRNTLGKASVEGDIPENFLK